jgi:hypothetical protein
MNVWKSPILYTGIGLVLIVGALIIAPWFIDWNSYRGKLESWGKSQTGREVTIVGDISARLFPWPSLRVEGLRIANPPEAKMPELLRAEAIDALFLLSPLLSGHFEVSAITIDKPVIGLERLATGGASWRLAPEDRDAMLPDNISFADISLRDGTVLLSDGVTGTAREITDFDAALSAPAVHGPWKLRGTFSERDTRIAIAASTGRIQPDAEMSFDIRLRPETKGGYEISFDGTTTAEGFAGKLAGTPVPDPADPEAKPTGFTLSAEAKGSLQALTLDKLEIVPADPDAAGNTLIGKAAIDFARQINLSADFSAPHFDLDKVAGPALPTLFNTQGQDALAQALRLAPGNVTARMGISLGSLKAGGDSLNNLALGVLLEDGILNITRAKATLPGQTDASFTGTFAFADAPRLNGALQLKSEAFRDLAAWGAPTWQAAIQQNWTGARGTLTLESPITLDATGTTLANADFTLDEAAGSLSLHLPGKDGISLRLLIDKLDLDRYVPEGVSTAAVAGLLTNTGSAAIKAGSADLTLQADRLMLNGVIAEDIAINAAASAEGLNIRTLDIGSVEGARLELAGLLKPDAAAPSGTGTLSITADEPHGLLRLLGLIPPLQARKPDPAWAEGLAPIAVTFKADVEASDGIASVTLESAGSAGGSALASNMAFRGEINKWRMGDVDIKGRITSPSTAMMAKLFGLPAPGADATSPATAEFNANGKIASGLETSATLEGFGGRSRFVGTLSADDKNIFSLRALGVLDLDAREGNALLAAMGIPAPPEPVNLKGDGRLDWRDGRFALRGFAGEVGGQKLSGDFAAAASGVEVDLKTENLSLPFVLANLLLRSDAAAPDMTTIFAKTPLDGSKGKFTLKAQNVTGIAGVNISDGLITAMADGNGLDFKLQAQSANKPITMAFRAVPENGGLKLDGTLQGHVLLAPLTGPALDGTAELDARFAGFGRSPAGLVLALGGNGKLTLHDLILREVNAPGLTSALASARAPADVNRAIQAQLRAGDLQPGKLTADFTITEGLLQSAAMPFTAGDVKGTFTPQFSFHEAKFDNELALAVVADMPPVSVVWAGPPGALVRLDQATGLISALSAKAMRDEMERLEAVQKEQQRLLAEEEKRAAEEEKARIAERAKRKAEEAARAAAAEETQRKLEEEAARRIAAEQAATPAAPTPVAPATKPKKKPLIIYDPFLIETAPLPPLQP